MKFEIKLDWAWILRKVRIVFLVGVFWALYTYVGAVWGFMWLAYFILNDLNDIEVTIDEDKEERHRAWKNISTRRKGF